ncbi:universal stress protein [Jannaschia ovalis]|uniref:Universal stress protein n=1 Tax=Jannaschia ovalis TaxID=3038773 RepID=A0ABY8LAS1_9RHOB|nr:universal stress protein [Jannaschia sp. GRR-S6-38]WGH78429.1 universal stress protein [Jannaschia sp. GRR-S6-38]
MFKRIMTPVDLGHVDKLGKSIDVAAALARMAGGTVTFVSVTANTPGKLAHTPKEFEAKLKAFAEAQAKSHGIEADAHMIVVPDPTAEVDDGLLHAAEELQADVVVMASHPPGLAEYFWPSNGGKVAAHSKASVFVVRDH